MSKQGSWFAPYGAYIWLLSQYGRNMVQDVQQFASAEEKQGHTMKNNLHTVMMR